MEKYFKTVLIKKLIATFVFAAILIKLPEKYSVKSNIGIIMAYTWPSKIRYETSSIFKDAHVQSRSFLFRIAYCTFTAYHPRFQYYFAWNLADLVCNSSGLGYNGYDLDGKPVWDQTSGFDFFRIEVG
jgi:hypothetical protein